MAAADWVVAVVELLAIADEASQGYGLPIPEEDEDVTGDTQTSKPGPWLVVSDYSQLYKEKEVWRDGELNEDQKKSKIKELQRHRKLKNLPHSITRFLDPNMIRVLPKSRKPDVGCNLRSLSHNLALVSDAGVTARWTMPQPRSWTKTPFNVLLVPYPYRIGDEAFVSEQQMYGAEDQQEYAHGSFSLLPKWLPDDDVQAGQIIYSLTSNLMTKAIKRFGEVHAIVFPESAMPYTVAHNVARRLSQDFPSLEMFITGAISTSREPTPGATTDAAPELPKNAAVNLVVGDGRICDKATQFKSHRWKLEQSQIARYALGQRLDPRCGWWENISISDRSVTFSQFRQNASMAVLICEDLARVDPVQPIVHAVGPSLLITLLLDGPQLAQRWPSRYATVLAEDPGSSVLTLTSLGMIRRSTLDGDHERRVIGLWKERGGAIKELNLEDATDAIALSLSLESEYEWSLDGRSNAGITCRVRLDGEPYCLQIDSADLRNQLGCASAG
jgi:hypothetical protein